MSSSISRRVFLAKSGSCAAHLALAALAMPPSVKLAYAGATFQLPASLGDWVLFGKVFYPRAFEAWYRELKGK